MYRMDSTDGGGTLPKLVDTVNRSSYGYFVATAGDDMVLTNLGETVCLFRVNASGANMLAPPLQIPDQDENAVGFGYSLAVSGTLAVVTAVSSSSNPGAIFIFRITGDTVWLINNRTAPEHHPTPTQTYYGYVLAMSGNCVAVSSRANDGTVYVHVIADDDSIVEIGRLVHDGPEGSNVQFGHALAMSANYLAVGTVYGGYVALFHIDMVNSLITRLTTLWNVEAAPRYFGQSLAISGNLLAVGSTDHHAVGCVYLYSLPSAQLLMKFRREDESGNAVYGTSIALVNRSLFVGDASDAASNGTVYMYDLPASVVGSG